MSTKRLPDPKCPECYGHGWVTNLETRSARSCDCKLPPEERRNKNQADLLEALADRMEAEDSDT